MSQVPVEHSDSYFDLESFEFGSCVFLHQFLYDHADEVRQRLSIQEDKDQIRQEISRVSSPPADNFRTIIANLGPPVVAGWSRPSMLTNGLPAYCRFQNFMFHNAFRGAESFIISRAVYDGGESKV